METPIQIYQPIDEVKSIISEFLNNVYNNEAYKEYLKSLEDDGSHKKVEKIKTTFDNIKLYNTNTEPLFIARDIGVLLGVSNINTTIKNYTCEEKIEGYIETYDKPKKKVMFLTRHGLYRLLFNNKTSLSNIFRKFVYKLLDDVIKHNTEKVLSILNEITREDPTLISESITEMHQNVNKYKALYELEQQERMKYYSKNLELNNERNELKLEKMFQEIKIDELSKQNDFMISKINSAYEYDDTESIVNILKHKYMKKVGISMVNPNLVLQILEREKNNEDFDFNFEKTQIYDPYVKLFEFVKKFKNESIYKNEIMYLHLSFNPKDDCEKYTHITNVYVYDKNKYSELIDTMLEECDYFKITAKKSTNDYIFRTNVDHISIIAENMIYDQSSK